MTPEEQQRVADANVILALPTVARRNFVLIAVNLDHPTEAGDVLSTIPRGEIVALLARFAAFLSEPDHAVVELGDVS